LAIDVGEILRSAPPEDALAPTDLFANQEEKTQDSEDVECCRGLATARLQAA
jgi:hypothetical protein